MVWRQAVSLNLMGTVSSGHRAGMSGHTEATAVMRHVLERAGIPLVIDADGLNALVGNTDIFKDRQVPSVDPASGRWPA